MTRAAERRKTDSQDHSQAVLRSITDRRFHEHVRLLHGLTQQSHIAHGCRQINAAAMIRRRCTRTAPAAAACGDASSPMSRDPVGTIPMRPDPHLTGNNGRRRIDDRRRSCDDRRRNTEGAWTPAAAWRAIMPTRMPTGAPMIPPRRCRRRYQRGHGKHGYCGRTQGNPHTERDSLHGKSSYQTQQRAGCTPPYGPT